MCSETLKCQYLRTEQLAKTTITVKKDQEEISLTQVLNLGLVRQCQGFSRGQDIDLTHVIHDDTSSLAIIGCNLTRYIIWPVCAAGNFCALSSRLVTVVMACFVLSFLQLESLHTTKVNKKKVVI